MGREQWGWWTGGYVRAVAARRRRAAALGVAVAAVLAASLVPATVAEATGQQLPPNPVAIARYLDRIRAGFGSPQQANALAGQAVAQAGALPVRNPGPPPGGAATPSSAALNALGTTWQPLGPAPVGQPANTNNLVPLGNPNSGRVDGVAVAQKSGKWVSKGEIFVATAGGGIWSSTDDGLNWITRTDHVAAGLAIGAIAIDPVNPNILYAGTGEGNNCNDCFYGGGVLKSTNGGTTWTVENPSGMFTGAHFSAIAVDPRDDQHVFAATDQGFYESTDGGLSWAHPSGTGIFTRNTTAIALDPSTPQTTVYIAGGPTTGGGLIQKSIDGGQNFGALGGGLPSSANIGFTSLGIGIRTAAHPTANQTLYASIQLAGTTDANGGDVSIFKTTDGGATWSALTIPAYTTSGYAYFYSVGGSGGYDQASYDNTIAVDPVNPAHVIAGGIAQIESTNGGGAWSNLNGHSFYNYYGPPPKDVLHPDTHALAFAPSRDVILGTDGGLYQYSGGGRTGVSNLNTNLNTTQAYEDVSVYQNGSRILAGLQDNGTVTYSGSPSWRWDLEGDGGYTAINPLDYQQQFSDANFYLVQTQYDWDDGAAGPGGITPPGGITNLVPPMTIVPNTASGQADAPTVYYGANDLWVTHAQQYPGPWYSWTQLTNVGAGVSAIAVAPSHPDDVYVGFDNGTLEVSTNATSNTPTFTTLSGTPSDWITHIAVSPTNPGSIAMSFSDSNVHKTSFPPMVQTATVTLTGTPSATFTDVTGNLPSGVASNSVVWEGSGLVVATDVGVFSTNSPSAGSTRWSHVGAGLPNVQVLGLTRDPHGDLFAATHGRGIWKLPVGNVTAAPMNTAAPKISGILVVGHTLSVSTGTWSHNPTGYARRWERCSGLGADCVAIPKASAATYKLAKVDAGHAIVARVMARNAGGNGNPVTSLATAPVRKG